MADHYLEALTNDHLTLPSLTSPQITKNKKK
jgi:hypothetical protein